MESVLRIYSYAMAKNVERGTSPEIYTGVSKRPVTNNQYQPNHSRVGTQKAEKP